MTENILSNTTFNEELVQLDLKVSDTFDALKKVASVLYASDLVEDSFLEAIIAREKEFPTGLPGTNFGFAMPHTDSIHVKKQSISIAILDQPVNFRVMGSESDEVEVNIIFMLAIKKSDDQLQFLQSLMGLFQSQETMEKLIGSRTREEVVKTFKEFINEENE